MGFKLGTSRGNYADAGEIKTKISFRRNQQLIFLVYLLLLNHLEKVLWVKLIWMELYL